ncbi:MAG: single-stranded-DNA-specific exonuclease RecJ [Gemmatimonadetes bacterium]|nr:single-stranded-DNA-specific exonuclease RecJ [Gemmatimonadota bacterium]
MPGTVAGEVRAGLPPLSHRWVARYPDEPDATAIGVLAQELHLPAELCRLLAQRGLADPGRARQYLRPQLDSLPDPYLLADLERAVARIGRAVAQGERILVHGDYDVDGICCAALYTRVLRAIGAQVEAFVPHRLTDGYDLSQAGVHRAAEYGARLILTGDCGIVAHEAVAAAQAAGIDVVVTDHHTPGETLPAAAAVVNPNRPDCGYPEKGLAGAGVAYKLCQALAAAHGLAEADLRWHLDLVALATIADLAPLTGENRVLAHFGLRVLAQTRNLGLAALLRTAGVDPEKGIAAGQVSHVLAPRLNAVGRLGAAERGVRLLLAENVPEAEALARESEEENRARQSLDRDTLQAALADLEQWYDPERDFGLVLAREGWHPGVIGIVASRVVERVHRPVVMVALDPGAGRGRGSARSIPRFDLYAAVHSCSALLERYGGHHQAAGLDVRMERLDAFRAAFNDYARRNLTPADLQPELKVDQELSLAAATPQLFALLRHVGPFGVGNPAPVFCSRGVRVLGYPREVGDGHIKLRLHQHGAELEAIGFRLAERLRELDLARGPIDVAFQLQENHWNGRVELQARLLDLRLAQ